MSYCRCVSGYLRRGHHRRDWLGPLGFTTAGGEQVGTGAAHGSRSRHLGVMVSESTARLVENSAVLPSVSWCDQGLSTSSVGTPSSGNSPPTGENGPRGGRPCRPRGGDRAASADSSTERSGQWVGRRVCRPTQHRQEPHCREITRAQTNAGSRCSHLLRIAHTDVPFLLPRSFASQTGSHGLDGAAAGTRVRARFSGADGRGSGNPGGSPGHRRSGSYVAAIDPTPARRSPQWSAAALPGRTPNGLTSSRDAMGSTGISDRCLRTPFRSPGRDQWSSSLSADTSECLPMRRSQDIALER